MLECCVNMLRTVDGCMKKGLYKVRVEGRQGRSSNRCVDKVEIDLRRMGRRMGA